MKGTVTAIIRRTAERNGGYFFVRDEQGHDRFAHARDLQGSRFDELQEKDQVEFEPLDGATAKGNGRRAEKVRRVA